MTAIAAIGVLVAFACGAFDLSVGAVLGLGVVMVTWLQAEAGWPAWLAVIGALGVGVAVGVANGLIVTRLRVNSFIATLAMASIVEAVIYGVTDGRQIVGSMSDDFLRFGQSQPFGVPAPIFYMAAVALLAWVVLEHTPVGRLIYAVGSNTEAARLSGIKTNRYLFGSLVASALLATIAGIVFAAKIGSASLTAGPALPPPRLRRGAARHHPVPARASQRRRHHARHLPGRHGQQGPPVDGVSPSGSAAFSMAPC